MTTVVWEDEELKEPPVRMNANGVCIQEFAGTRTQLLDRWGETWTGLLSIANGMYALSLDNLPLNESLDVVKFAEASIADFRWPPSGLTQDYYVFAREAQLRAHA